MGSLKRSKGEVKRRRRPRWIVPALALLLLFALLRFGPLLLMSFAPIRGWVLSSALSGGGLGENVRVEIDRVTRLDIGGVTLQGVELQVRTPDGEEWQPAIRCGRLAANWSLPRLATGTAVVHAVTIGPLVVSLDRLGQVQGDARGRPATPAKGRPDWLPEVSVERLRIGPFEIGDASGPLLRGDLRRAEVQASHTEIDLLITNAWVAAERLGLDVRVSGGECTWRGKQGELLGLAFAGERARGFARGLLDTSGETPRLKLDVTLEKADPELVTALYFPEVRPAPGDSLAGIVSVERHADRLDLDLVLSGRLQGEEFGEISGLLSLTDGPIRFEDVRVSGDLGRIQGSGSWDGARTQLQLDLNWRELDHRSACIPWLHTLPIKRSAAGSARLALHFPSPETFRLDLETEVVGAPVWEIPTRKIRFSGRIGEDDAVRADRCQILVEGGEIRAHGLWPLTAGAIDAAAEIDSIPLTILPEAWRLGIEGELWGHLDISGAPDDPGLEGTLYAGGLSRGLWRAESMTATSLLLWPKDLRGSGMIEVQGLRKGEGPGSWLKTRFSRWDEWLSLTSDLRTGSASLHTEGRVNPNGAVELENATLSLQRLGLWRLAAPFGLTWSGAEVSADTLCLRSGPSRVCAQGRWLRGTDTIEAYLRLRDFEVARLHGLLGGKQDLRGRCGFTLVAQGQLRDPDLQLTVVGDSLAWGPLDLGALRLDARWRDSTLAIGPVVAVSRQQTVQMPTLRLESGHPLLEWFSADSAAADEKPSLADGQWRGHLEIEHLDLARWAAQIGLGGLQEGDATGRAIEVRPWVAGRQVPIRVVAPWELGPTAGGVGGLGGDLRTTVRVAGTPGSPRLEVDGAVADLSLARLPMGNLAFDMSYENAVLFVRRLELTDELQTSWARGAYPFMIRMIPLEFGPRDWPADLTVELVDLNLALLSGFIRSLPDAHGRLSGRLSVKGSGTEPELEGGLHLHDGGFRVPGRSERIYGLTAAVELDGRDLHLRSLEARAGPRGTLSASGWLSPSKKEFDLRAHAREVRIFEEGGYEFQVSAESLHCFTTPGETAEDPPRGHLEGKVEVETGTYTPQFKAAGRAARSDRPVPWDVDLDIEVPGSIRVSQTNAKVDVGDGALRVTYHWPYWNASGNLAILDGTYRLLNNNFNITGGTLEFRDTGTGLDVTVEVDGETHVASVTAGADVAETVTIEVQVQGKPEELEATFSSTPPLSREEIFELLSYGRFMAATDAETQRLLFNTETQGILLSAMVEQIESSLSEQIPFLSRVGVEAGASGEDPWRVNLQQMITPAFTGHYSREFYRGEDWTLSLDYRLSRILYLRAGVAHDAEQRDRGLDDEYSLDLKCRFEYE